MSHCENQNRPLSKGGSFTGRDVITDVNDSVTGWAFPAFYASSVITVLRTKLEKRWLAFVIAACAKPMNWFGALCLWLQHKSRSPRVSLFHLIALLLSFPCFQISHL